jgi:fibronectin-binding autotransporter adhesin
MAAIKWGSGTSGNWSLGSNWSGGIVPTGADDVTIDAAGSYTINVNGGFNVNSLVFNASTATINIATGDSLNAVHGATITGGTIDGPGHLFTSDVSVITSGTPLTLGGGLIWEALSGSVSFNAAVNVGDAAGPTATIETFGGTTFNLISDVAGIGVNPSGNGNFQNGGTLAKTGGTGISHIAVSFASTGTVSVTTGVLEFDGPSNTLGGTISGTGTVAFGAGRSQLAINPTVSNFLVDGGNVNFTPALNYFGNFSETSGVLTLGGTTPTITRLIHYDRRCIELQRWSNVHFASRDRLCRWDHHRGYGGDER